MKTFSLGSTQFVYTPGIFKMCLNQWNLPQNRRWVRSVLAAWNISNPVITGLMTGKIPYRIENDSVVFECESVS
jgi:hypothetical protein